MRLLIVEDEAKVAAAMREGLTDEGYHVAVESNGDGAIVRLATEQFDLVLLDLGLPGRDGLDVLRALREKGEQVLVLVLTARDAVSDRVAGLESGADDYLVKPFAFAELLARIRALLRRGVSAPATLCIGDVLLDRVARVVSRQGVPLDLTQREYQVLEYLMRREGQVVSRESLTRDVWNERERSPTLDNVIDVHIARLRRKMDASKVTSLIRTVRGVGYRLGGDEP